MFSGNNYTVSFVSKQTAVQYSQCNYHRGELSCKMAFDRRPKKKEQFRSTVKTRRLCSRHQSD